MIDRVNELDETVGLVARGRVFQEGAGFRVSHVILTDPQGRLLLERLSPNAARSPGLLGSTAAGYLNAGESYADGARRRLLEERGADLPLRKLGVINMPDTGDEDGPVATKFIGLFTATTEPEPTASTTKPEPTASTTKPEPTASTTLLLSEDSASLEWFSRDEIDALMTTEPRVFTSTFPYVYRLYSAALSDALTSRA
jgi:ADP-ribose pyrophosphatase YjhB (NUDIX family)